MSRVGFAFAAACLLLIHPFRCLGDLQSPGYDPRNVLNGVAYGAGTFVAVGGGYSDARITVSSNGLVWSNQLLSIAGNLNAVTFGGGLFVAVGGSASAWRLIMTSSNAVDWRVLIAGQGAEFVDVAYGNGRFVAIGSGIVATSTNGADWVSQDINDNIQCVAYGNGLFVAGTTTGAGLLTSSDGLTWNPVTFLAAVPADIAFGNGLFVMVTSTATYSSADGTNWMTFAGVTRPTAVVTFGAGVFVGSDGNALFVSQTGQVWDRRYLDNMGGFVSDVTFGGGRFVAVGREPYPAQKVRLSTDNGINWSVVSFAPFISSQPQSQFSQPGNYVYLYVGVGATEPIGYQWYHNGTPLGSPTLSPWLTIPNITTNDLGNYYAVVRNSAGAATTQVARVTFDPHPPSFPYYGPNNAWPNAGSQLDLTPFLVVGDRPMAFQWQRNGVNIPGATNDFLSISSVTTNDSGCYWLIASNHAGVATSSVAVVTVLFSPPSFYISPGSQSVFAGTPVTLTAVGSAGPAPSYRWFFNGFILPGATSHALFLGNVNTNQAGTYSVVISNYLGVVSNSVQLLVQLQAPIFANQPGDQYAIEGTAVTFFGSAYGGPLPSYFLQFNGEPVALPYRPGFSILEVTTNDAGLYEIIASNYLGMATSRVARLTVTPAGPLDRWTKRNPLPQGSHLLALGNDGQRLVAVGESGAIVTSTNGIQWQTQPHRTDVALTGVAYGNGLFVAVGEGGTILSSSNLTDWTWRTSAADQQYSSVAYGNGRFVAVGNYLSLVITSPDGITWTHSYVPDSQNLNAVVFANGRFIAVGSSGRIVTSTDGTNWGLSSTVTFSTLEAAGFGNGVYIAAGNDGRVLTSTDGLQWVPHSTPTTRRLLGVAYGNGRYVAVGTRGTLLSSVDGGTWVAENSGTPDRLEAVSFLNGLFIAVGENGTTITSPDGSHWTKRNLGSTRDLDGITFTGKQIVVAGKFGTVLTSGDGNHYLEQNTGVTNDIHGIAFANGLLAAVGEGIVMTSSNAVDWTVRFTDTLSSLKSVVRGATKWIAVGTSGTIVRSSDGITWQQSFGPNAYDLNDVAYGNGLFVIVGDAFRPNGTIWTSPDGLVWTDRTYPTGKNLRAVTYANGMFLAVGNDGTMLVSSDGINWSPRSSGLSNDGDNLRAAFYRDGLWTVVGNRGIILTSTNALQWTRRPARTLENLHGVRSIDGTLVTIGNRGNILQTPRVFGAYLTVRGYQQGVGFEFALNAEPGQQHRLQASGDLVTWSDLLTFDNSQPETIYFDEDAALLPQRFYRIVTP